MSNSINIGAQGVLGWNIFKRAEGNLLEGLRRSAQIQDSISYFSSNIEKISSPDGLVDDYRMLSFVLKANGLGGDISNRAFIKKVIESNLSDQNSFANRLGDKRYARLAYSVADYWTGETEDINRSIKGSIDLYVERTLQERIGASDGNLALVLNARRELVSLAERASSEKSFWYEILGNVPLRTVLEGALGLSANYRKLDIDRQMESFSAAARLQLKIGSGVEVSLPEVIESIAKRYLARSAASASGSHGSPYGIALAILRFRAN